MLKTNGLCINCLRHGHFVRSCKSLHKCQVCQKPHHTLLHIDEKSDSSPHAGAVSDATASATSTRITGVAGFVSNSAEPVTTFQVSSVHDLHKKFPVTAVIVSV